MNSDPEVILWLGLKHVYIYSVGSNCYKIGRTKHTPEKRKRGWATGSPVKPKLYRDVLTEHPSALENYIHHDLDLKRRENGEFFNVTEDELDTAVKKPRHLRRNSSLFSMRQKG